MTDLNPIYDPTTRPVDYYHTTDTGRTEPVFVTLDTETGDLWAEVEYRSSGTPIRVWHGLALRWEVPVLRPETMNTLIREILPLAQRILDGADSRWDGSNWRGTLTPDAEAAVDAIADHIAFNYEYSDVHVWDAADWFSDVAADFMRRLRDGESIETIKAEWTEQDGTPEFPILTWFDHWFEQLANRIADEDLPEHQ